MGRALGVEAEDLIREGVELDDARARLIDRRAAIHTSPLAVGGDPDMLRGHQAVRGHRALPGGWLERSQPAITAGGSLDDFRAAAVDAVLLRAGVQLDKAHPAARDVSASVVDLARVCVSRAGRTVSGGTETLIRSAMSSSDFPLILADALHKATRRGYEDEPASHRQWGREQPVQDFRDQHRVILGSAPELESVNEGGEYKQGPMDEDAASYRVAKYGKIVSLTWEALVNDDVSSFLRVQPAMGQAARRKEADTVYGLFGENGGDGPTMQDGVVLFHADHGNLATAGNLDADGLGAGRALLRKQTALGGGYLSLVPRFLIVPAELETEADMLLAAATRHVSQSMEAETPRWLGNLELVVEPRLADDGFYLAADSAQIDHCELGLLEENVQGPSIEEDREFVRDVFRWRVRHVLGAKFLDWRGIVKIPLA